MNLAALATLTIALALGAGDEPPTEFRIFRAGENETTKGTFLFDETAAKSVMADYADWGVDLMVDYEHASLRSTQSPDPAQAGKAAAWLNLELRDGELWAVNVRWTEPAAAALRRKEWRYFSPAFFPPKPGRVERMVNLALTNIPAMKRLEPLMAASARVAAEPPPARDHRPAELSSGASLQDVQRALQSAVADLYPPPADGFSVGPYVCDVYDATAVYEYDGKLFEVPYTFDGVAAKLGAPVPVKRAYQPLTEPAAAPPASAPDETTEASRLSQGATMDRKTLQAAVDALKNADGAKALELLEAMLVGAGSGGEPPPPDDAPAPAEEMAAASRKLMQLTGKPTLAEALPEFERRNKRIGELEEQEAKLAKDNATLIAGRRDAAVAEMVTLGAELPATAWADPLVANDRTKRKPAEPWASQAIESLEARVAALRAAPSARREVRPPPAPATGALDLTEEQVAYCKANKIDPAKFAEQRAAIRARSVPLRS